MDTLMGSDPCRRGQIQRPALGSGAGTTLGSEAFSLWSRYMAEPNRSEKTEDISTRLDAMQ